MAMNPDIGPMVQPFATEMGSAEVPQAVKSNIIFSADDPRLEEMTREQRVQHYFARELALGNTDAFLPRYRASDHDSDNPWADHAVPDPLADPHVAELATQMQLSGIRREISELIED